MNKVYVEECDAYELAPIKKFITNVLTDLPHVTALFQPGSRIFVKLNLLTDRTPEQFTTTHPVFVQALIQCLKAFGCQIVLGDSPAGKMNPERLKHIYQVTGFSNLAAAENVELNYDCSAVRLNGILQVKAMQDADVVINVCKLKTHVLTTFTGAVKNCFGSVWGEYKHKQHALHPTPKSFSNYLLKVAETLRPELSLMDGIIGMQGNGPSNGMAYPAHLMLAAENPYALDHMALRLLQIPEQLVMTDVLAHKNQLYEAAELVSSASMAQLMRYDFLLPDSSRLLRRDVVTKYPQFDSGLCIGCQACLESCPQKTIIMVEHKAVLQPEKCIKCYCCQEICPANAIKVT